MKKLSLLLASILLLAACSEEEAAEPAEQKEAVEEVEQVEAPEETEDTPKGQIESAFENDVDAEIISLNGQFFQEPYSVQVEFMGTENLSHGMTVEGMRIGVRDAIYAVKESGLNISDIMISYKYPLVDQSGNTTEEYVIKSTFSQETIDGLNDEKMAINTEDLPDLASEWWEHDVLNQ